MTIRPPRGLHRALFALQIVCLAAGAAQALTRIPFVAVLVHGPENTHRARVDALREFGYAEGRSFALVLR